jgi:hypothetical protein
VRGGVSIFSTGSTFDRSNNKSSPVTDAFMTGDMKHLSKPKGPILMLTWNFNEALFAHHDIKFLGVNELLHHRR